MSEEYISGKKKAATFFTNAPVVIAVFMTKADYYDPTFISVLKERGFDDEGIMELFNRYDLLSIGAAVENLLLAAHEKGYGACWMNEPALAGEEIGRILNAPPGAKLISLVPVGVPAYFPREKRMKDWNEVFSRV